jgi:signal transduction histidine kinase
MNILSNAIKFTPFGERITVFVKCEEGFSNIKVIRL